MVWREEGWFVRDLASTNGTFVDQKRAGAGERVRVVEGAGLQFGGDGDGLTYRLVDGSPPGPAAVEAGTGRRFSGTGLLSLPSAEEPELTVFVSEDGEWICERDGEPFPVSDQMTIESSSSAWLLELPDDAADTRMSTTAGRPACSLEAIHMSFRTSMDEEFVEVRVRLPSKDEFALSPRAFHYMLLTLARARQRDELAGLPATERGWLYTEELANSLAVTRQKLNLDVCRARQQLSGAGIDGAGRLVQRRPTSGQLRLGISLLTVQGPV